MIKIYGIKNCDTIKKTLRWFESNNLEYQFIDYKKQPPEEPLARDFINTLGWETVINKRGTTCASWMRKPKMLLLTKPLFR